MLVWMLLNFWPQDDDEETTNIITCSKSKIPIEQTNPLLYYINKKELNWTRPVTTLFHNAIMRPNQISIGNRFAQKSVQSSGVGRKSPSLVPWQLFGIIDEAYSIILLPVNNSIKVYYSLRLFGSLICLVYFYLY